MSCTYDVVRRSAAIVPAVNAIAATDSWNRSRAAAYLVLRPRVTRSRAEPSRSDLNHGQGQIANIRMAARRACCAQLAGMGPSAWFEPGSVVSQDAYAAGPTKPLYASFSLEARRQQPGRSHRHGWLRQLFLCARNVVRHSGQRALALPAAGSVAAFWPLNGANYGLHPSMPNCRGSGIRASRAALHVGALVQPITVAQ